MDIFNEFCNNGLPGIDNGLKDTLTLFDLFETPKEVLNEILQSRGQSAFDIIPSSKTRGIRYRIEENNNILTKPNENIPVKLVGGAIGDYIYVSLRYEDGDSLSQAVVCNLCPHNNKRCVGYHPSTFCITSSDHAVEYRSLKDVTRTNDTGSGSGEHPTAVVTLADPQVEKEIFCFSDKCLNSCDAHKANGRRRLLILQHFSKIGELLCRSDWHIRVCENLKRDSKAMESCGNAPRNAPGLECKNWTALADHNMAPEAKVQKLELQYPEPCEMVPSITLAGNDDQFANEYNSWFQGVQEISGEDSPCHLINDMEQPKLNCTAYSNLHIRITNKVNEDKIIRYAKSLGEVVCKEM